MMKEAQNFTEGQDGLKRGRKNIIPFKGGVAVNHQRCLADNADGLLLLDFFVREKMLFSVLAGGDAEVVLKSAGEMQLVFVAN